MSTSETFQQTKAQLKASIWLQHFSQDRQAIVAKMVFFFNVFTKVFAQQSPTRQQSRAVGPQRQRYESGFETGCRRRRRWLAADDCTQADEIMKPADLQRLASDGEAAVAAAGCSAPPN